MARIVVVEGSDGCGSDVGDADWRCCCLVMVVVMVVMVVVAAVVMVVVAGYAKEWMYRIACEGSDVQDRR